MLVLETDFCRTRDVKCFLLWRVVQFGKHQPRWPGSENLSFWAQGKEGKGTRERVEVNADKVSQWTFKTALDSGKESFGIFCLLPTPTCKLRR